tara:strand:- start:492 stop:722 length:231 start_codon:yes stop_codon:yes gene_type:complete
MTKNILDSFELKLAKALTNYENLFGTPAPVWGYDEDELLELLESAIDDKVEMKPVSELVFKNQGIKDVDGEVDIKT